MVEQWRAYSERNVPGIHNDKASDVKGARGGNIDTTPPIIRDSSTIRDVVYLQDDISSGVDIRQLLRHGSFFVHIENITEVTINACMEGPPVEAGKEEIRNGIGRCEIFSQDEIGV